MKNIKVFVIVFLMLFLCGCSIDGMIQSTQNMINKKVEQAKQEVSNQISESVQNTVNNKVDTVVNSVESKLDPELGQIRENMRNIKETALVYYDINGNFPKQQKVQSFFEKQFNEMNIKYKISDNRQKAFISYTGKKYSKDKIPDININSKDNQK